MGTNDMKRTSSASSTATDDHSKTRDSTPEMVAKHVPLAITGYTNVGHKRTMRMENKLLGITAVEVSEWSFGHTDPAVKERYYVGTLADWKKYKTLAALLADNQAILAKAVKLYAKHFENRRKA